MSLYDTTKQRCPELAAFLEDCCAAPLSFDGAHPILHSSRNHIHLWALEYWADHHDWIDLDYRLEFVSEIFKRWRGRLKGLPPYRDGGYRLYLYEDMAPTISVVANTAFGFPYPGTPSFVDQRSGIMGLYLDRSWRAHFEAAPFEITPKTVLDQIEKSKGSISKPTAEGLGVKVGALRTLIEQMGLQSQVNDIRKRYKRRPAQFRHEDYFHRYAIHEQMLPAGY